MKPVSQNQNAATALTARPAPVADGRTFGGQTLWHSCAHCSGRCGGIHGRSHIVAGVVLCPGCYTAPAPARGEMLLVEYTA